VSVEVSLYSDASTDGSFTDTKVSADNEAIAIFGDRWSAQIARWVSASERTDPAAR
jgi:hypothetical protein